MADVSKISFEMVREKVYLAIAASLLLAPDSFDSDDWELFSGSCSGLGLQNNGAVPDGSAVV